MRVGAYNRLASQHQLSSTIEVSVSLSQGGAHEITRSQAELATGSSVLRRVFDAGSGVGPGHETSS